MEFSTIFKSLRLEAGKNQNEIAEQFNTTRSTISDWENKRSQPSIEQFYVIADYFSCSVDYLIGRTDDFGNIRSAVVIDKDIIEVQKLYAGLSKERKAAILDILRALART